jgi:hypothetical protein
MANGPFIRRRITLPHGRVFSWSIRPERNNVGHFNVEGAAFDGWLDGWALTDEELERAISDALS